MKILKGLFLHPILGCLLIPSLVPISPESLAVDASRTIESNHPPFLSETLETLTNTTLFPDFLCDIDFDPNQAGESLNSADEGQIAAPLESVVNEILSESYPPNGFHDEITSSNPHAPLSWKYYRFDIPNGILAWRLYVDQVVSGYPSIFIGRGVLPDGKNTPRINDRGEPREDGGFYSQLKQGDQMRAYTSWFSLPNEILSRDIMLAGGAPLITLPDTDVPYFIGIFNGSNDPAVYEFHSSIIDDELTPFSSEIQGVDSLDFEGGIASIQDLNADTALFFKTVILEGKRTWRLELNPSQGDAKMYVRRDFIPDYTATYVSSGFGGVKMDREGPEMYYELPYKIGFASNEEFLNPGEYYIAVVPDPGIPFSGELLSLGEIPITSIPSTETTQEIPFSLAGAEIQLFQLEEMVGDHSIAIELKDLSGDVDLAVRADHLIPSPSNAQLYGFTGNNTSTRSNIGIVGLNILQPGFRTILIQSRQLSSFAPNLTGVLKITRTAVETIDLNEGVIQIEGQAPYSWKIFKISIPEDGRLNPNEEPILGWFPEVIESVQSSFPETTMLIRKGIPPEGTHEFFFDFPRVQGFDGGRPSKSSIWPEEAIWPSRMILNSRHGLLAAWNKPLDGGTYYAGVYNPSRENSVSYTFRSRTLGQPGSSSSIQVKELEFENGEENIVNQLAGEISFYKVTTPEENEEARSWHAFVKPEGTGELSMAIRSDFIPDFNAKDHPSDILSDIGGGAFLEKQGKELFQIFPEEGEMFLDGAKDYYIAVTSLGNEVINNVKSGQVNFTIHSEGEIPIQEIDVSTGSAEIDFNLEVEEVNLYSLYIPENSLSIEISLEDLAGGYVSFAIRKGALVPKGLRFSNYYGLFGGTEESAVHSDSLIAINNPSPGIYTLILKSPLERGTSSKPDVNGKLKFKLFSEIELAFSGGESEVVEQLPNT